MRVCDLRVQVTVDKQDMDGFQNKLKKKKQHTSV